MANDEYSLFHDIRHSSFVIAFLLLSGRTLFGHDEKVSASEVRVESHEIVWKVDVGLAGLEKALKLPAAAAQLSERQLQLLKPQIANYLSSEVSVEINGRVAVAEIGELEPVYEPFLLSGEPYIARVRQLLLFRSQEEARRLRLGIRLFSELTAEHRALVHVRWGGQERQFVRVGPSTLDLSYDGLHPDVWRIAAEFLSWGARHIFIGYDHIAFLLALLLAARRVREMVLIVTSFTVAHSLTLLLSALDLIRLPPALTESLIAASIVYVSVENYFLKDGRHRWLLTFAFGLVHGLGFSSVLRERLADVSGVVLPVLSFNLGVEAGQLVILMVAFPLILALCRAADERSREIRQRRLLWIGSAPILLLGLGWLVERVFGIGFMPL